MELQITGTNIEITAETQRYVAGKLNKLTKHMPDIIDVKVEINVENTKSPQQRYTVRAAVNSGLGKSVFHGEERGEDLFKAIDKVAAVLTTQLDRQKGKIYDRGRGSEQVRGKFPEPAEAGTARQIVKTKNFVIEPMSQAEALAAMEQLGHDFFLFYDGQAGGVRLVYRRRDGNYGLIIPEFKS